jgi:hypothetical protein
VGYPWLVVLAAASSCVDPTHDGARADTARDEDSEGAGSGSSSEDSGAVDAERPGHSDGVDSDAVDSDAPRPPFPALVPCPLGGVRSGLTIHDATVVRWGAVPGDALGVSLAVGDLDVDGVPEVAVGAGMQWATDPVGAVFVLRSPWRATWQAVNPTVDATFGLQPLAGFGGRLEIADLDGDGVGEAVVGARHDGTGGHHAGAVYRLDDADLRRGRAPRLAVRGADAYDELGFGFALVPRPGGASSLVVGAPGWRATGGPSSGSPGALWRVDPPVLAPVVATPPVPGWRGAGLDAGYDVAIVGDHDADGVEDVLVGGSGRAWLVSGADLADPAGATALATFVAPDGFDEEAIFVDGGRDLDADGRPDLVLGSLGDVPLPCESADTDACGGSEYQLQRGVVWVFLRAVVGDVDLATADVRIQGHAPADWTGLTFLSSEDLDRDGKAELLVAHDDKAASHVHRFSGFAATGPMDVEDGELLTAMDARAQAIAVADVTGDGQADLLLGEPLAGTGGARAGRVRILELCPAKP